jgi:hypothetical protein
VPNPTSSGTRRWGGGARASWIGGESILAIGEGKNSPQEALYGGVTSTGGCVGTRPVER